MTAVQGIPNALTAAKTSCSQSHSPHSRPWIICTLASDAIDAFREMASEQPPQILSVCDLLQRALALCMPLNITTGMGWRTP